MAGEPKTRRAFSAEFRMEALRRIAERRAAEVSLKQIGCEAVADQPGLDRTGVSDCTCVPTREGWLFLVVVRDLASRRVVGWAVRETMETELAVAALQAALADRRPAPGLVCHSDRGSHPVRERRVPRTSRRARRGGEHEPQGRLRRL